MGRNKIYQDDLGYTILKPIVDWNLKNSYRKVEVRGEENLPTDGPIILAPNHCNTLMDALVMLRAYNKPTVFGARADMFNNKMVAKIMYFLRILPMVRQRDGLRNVLKNVETQDIIVETLEHDVRFCIFPEGRHRAAKSLLPLGKGICRAALAANTKFGDKKPIYIVPVGIEYGDFFRYRSTSLVTYGKPINVTEFVKSIDTDNEAQIIDHLKKELTIRMSEAFTFIKDDEKLNEKWVLTKMLYAATSKKGYGNFCTSLSKGMAYNRKLVAAIENACETHPEKLDSILAEVKEFEKQRRKDGISIYSFYKRNKAVNMVRKGIAALLGLPYFVFSAIACLPMWTLEMFLRSKIKDRAFRNTGSFGVKLALGPIWFLITAILSFCLSPWQIALAICILAIPSYSYFHDYIEGARRFLSDVKLLSCKKLSKKFKSIVSDFNKL